MIADARAGRVDAALPEDWMVLVLEEIPVVYVGAGFNWSACDVPMHVYRWS